MKPFPRLTSDASWAAIIGISVVAIFTRIPLMFAGFGEDSDAWLMIYTSRRIASGIWYEASRLPGYPIIEYVHALIEYLGASTPLLHNCVALFAGLALGILFYLHTNKLIATFGLLLHPLIWIHSATSMDYMVGAVFLFAAWVAAQSRPILSGILGGLASGTRLPLAIASISIARRWSSIVIWVIVSMAAFLPVFITYGIDFFSYAMSDIRLVIVVYKLVQEVFGPLLIIAMLLIGSINWNNIRCAFRDPASGRLLLTIGILGLPYLALPVETAYLISAIPFVYLLAVQYLPKRWLRVFVVLPVINGFVSFGIIDTFEYREHKRLKIDVISSGSIIRDYQLRNGQLNRAKRLATGDYPASSFIYVDALPLAIVAAEPSRWHLNNFNQACDTLRSIALAGSLSKDNIEVARADGLSIYYLANRGLRYRLMRIYGYEPESLGIMALDIGN